MYRSCMQSGIRKSLMEIHHKTVLLESNAAARKHIRQTILTDKKRVRISI